ncbi:hypothetical protein FSP39_017546 [Pinctada imbricata]|uniref:Uncharacterized protein n=1 Tax=Pinctada imbricata TaxID=66713 RepID=A0AA89C1T2_PINIB|nr:hypothetical protein FSP39_017546 [Pinctada imbricata]
MVKGICKEDNFKSLEYSPKQMKETCEYLLKNHRRVIEDGLINYYKEKDRKHLTYLDVVQQICSNRIKVCHGATDHIGDHEDGKIVYNPDTEEFDVIPGKKVKIARPGRHISDEL